MSKPAIKTVWTVAESTSFAQNVFESDDKADVAHCAALNRARGIVGYYQVSRSLSIDGRTV